MTGGTVAAAIRTFGLVAAGGLALVCAGPAMAQRWTIEPSIATQATLTNNANYESGTQSEADLIVNVFPAVSFTRDGPRLKIRGSAGLNVIGYADGSQSNRIQPRADILANLEAIDRLLYVEAALVANQEWLNPFLAQDDTASTSNRYTYIQSRISPYIQGGTGTDWRYLIRSDNSYTQTTQGGGTLADAYFGRHVAEIVRLPTPGGASLRVQREITRFDRSGDSEQRLDLALARLTYAFAPHLTASLRGGYEQTNYTSSDTSGSFYGVDLAWSTPHSSLGGFWENRFFGPSYQADVSTRQRRLALNLSATRSITTYPELILQLPITGNVSSLLNAILVARFPDPIERAQQVRDLLERQGLPNSLPNGVNIYSQGVNVVTSGSGTFALTGVRNTLALTIYYVRTTLLPDAAIPPTFITFNNNIQKGVSLSLGHRLNALTTLNTTATRLQVRGFDQSAGTHSDQYRLQVQATQKLTPHSSAFIGARYQQQDANSGGIRDANETAIFVGLFYRL
ncbi:MAG: TIGR03016 family PEP-CTERM system-associated outer membrane protein [Burkholderiaceae bacterium]